MKPRIDGALRMAKSGDGSSDLTSTMLHRDARRAQRSWRRRYCGSGLPDAAWPRGSTWTGSWPWTGSRSSAAPIPSSPAARAIGRPGRPALGVRAAAGACRRFCRSSRAAPPAPPARAGDLHAAFVALPAGHGRSPGGLPRIHREAALHQCSRGGRYRRLGPRPQPQGRGRPPVPACPQPGRGPRRLAAGAIGPVRLVTAVLARPWLTTLGQAESTWRFDPKVSGGGILADAGDHLVDALLWTTGQVGREVGAFQSQCDPGIDLVTAAAIRLADGTPVTLAISGISPGPCSRLDYFGELGRLRATDQTLEEERLDSPPVRQVPLASPDPDHRRKFRGRPGEPLRCAVRPNRPRHRPTPRSHRAVRRDAASRSTHLSDHESDERRRGSTDGRGSTPSFARIRTFRPARIPFRIFEMDGPPRRESFKVSQSACRPFRVAADLNASNSTTSIRSGTGAGQCLGTRLESR